MIVATFKFYESSNNLESETILANSKDEAEEYLRTIKRNGVYKIKDLNIEHSYIIGEPTNYKVFSRNENGEPLVLEWREKGTTNSGRLKLWTELPSRIKKGSYE